MRPYHLIGDPRIDPPEERLCGDCDAPLGKGEDCPRCEDVRRLREDVDPEDSRRRKRH